MSSLSITTSVFNLSWWRIWEWDNRADWSTYIDPQSRTPSTDSEAGAHAECEQDVVPQGQTLKDSGVEGDNGRVEDSPNQRRHGGVRVSEEDVDVGVAETSVGDVHPEAEDNEGALVTPDDNNPDHEVVSGAGLRPTPQMLLRLSYPRAWRCIRQRCQRCVRWAIIRSG